MVSPTRRSARWPTMLVAEAGFLQQPFERVDSPMVLERVGKLANRGDDALEIEGSAVKEQEPLNVVG